MFHRPFGGSNIQKACVQATHSVYFEQFNWLEGAWYLESCADSFFRWEGVVNLLFYPEVLTASLLLTTVGKCKRCWLYVPLDLSMLVFLAWSHRGGVGVTVVHTFRYRFLRAEQPAAFPGKQPVSRDGAIRWNYEKFLVDAQGTPVRRYAPKQDPLSLEDDLRLVLVCAT